MEFDESRFECHLAGNPSPVRAEFLYWVCKRPAKRRACSYVSNHGGSQLDPCLAHSTCCGRWGAAGAPGVVRVLELLEAEVLECLGLLGVTSLSQLDRSYVRPAPPVGPAGVHSAFPFLTLTGGS